MLRFEMKTSLNPKSVLKTIVPVFLILFMFTNCGRCRPQIKYIKDQVRSHESVDFHNNTNKFGGGVNKVQEIGFGSTDDLDAIYDEIEEVWKNSDKDLQKRTIDAETNAFDQNVGSRILDANLLNDPVKFRGTKAEHRNFEMKSQNRKKLSLKFRKAGRYDEEDIDSKRHPNDGKKREFSDIRGMEYSQKNTTHIKDTVVNSNLIDETNLIDDDGTTDDWSDRHDQHGRFGKTATDQIFHDDDVENIIDYFFIDEAGVRDSDDHGDSKQGLVINLSGLIRNDDSDDVVSEVTPGGEEEQHEHMPDDDANDNNGRVLTFKIFEPPQSSSDPGRLQSRLTEAREIIVGDHSGLSGIVDNQNTRSKSLLSASRMDQEAEINDDTGENRNLSRKRRQKSSPMTEEQRQRRGFVRRRRRKRKRRHRHLLKTTDTGGETHLALADKDSLGESSVSSQSLRNQERFLLRSNSPAYVITTASEVKKDWCRTVPMKQKVVEKNCRPRVITNNFCYGQCNSFFIPHPGRTGNRAAFQSCAFCKPHRPKWTTVTLQCPGQNPPKKEKRVLVVESCRCITEVFQ